MNKGEVGDKGVRGAGWQLSGGGQCRLKCLAWVTMIKSRAYDIWLFGLVSYPAYFRGGVGVVRAGSGLRRMGGRKEHKNPSNALHSKI